MLCKVSSGNITGNISDIYTFNGALTPSSSSPYTYDLPNYTPKPADYICKCSGSVSAGYYQEEKILKLNGTQIFGDVTGDYATSTFSNVPVTIPANANLNLVVTSQSTSSRPSCTLESFTLDGNYTKTISKTVFTHKAKPRELKAIGDKATATLFGYHTDNTWYAGE